MNPNSTLARIAPWLFFALYTFIVFGVGFEIGAALAN